MCSQLGAYCYHSRLGGKGIIGGLPFRCHDFWNGVIDYPFAIDGEITKINLYTVHISTKENLRWRLACRTDINVFRTNWWHVDAQHDSLRYLSIVILLENDKQEHELHTQENKLLTRRFEPLPSLNVHITYSPTSKTNMNDTIYRSHSKLPSYLSLFQSYYHTKRSKRV